MFLPRSDGLRCRSAIQTARMGFRQIGSRCARFCPADALVLHIGRGGLKLLLLDCWAGLARLTGCRSVTVTGGRDSSGIEFFCEKKRAAIPAHICDNQLTYPWQAGDAACLHPIRHPDCQFTRSVCGSVRRASLSQSVYADEPAARIDCSCIIRSLLEASWNHSNGQGACLSVGRRVPFTCVCLPACLLSSRVACLLLLPARLTRWLASHL